MSNATFIPVRTAAVRLGLPIAWLVREVRAGRVPAVRAGRRLLVNPATVQTILSQRAETPAAEVAHG